MPIVQPAIQNILKWMLSIVDKSGYLSIYMKFKLKNLKAKSSSLSKM